MKKRRFRRKSNPEWSFGKTLVRIIAYTFCLGLLCLFAYAIFVERNYALGIVGAIFPIAYIYSDITILINKNENKEVNNWLTRFINR